MAPSPETLAFLREVRLFAAFADADLLAVAELLRTRTLRRRQVLFREGDRGDEMFIVRRGTMLVSKEITGKVEQVLVRVEAGDFFGEMSLLDGEPRSATVKAETDLRLLVINRRHFWELLREVPELTQRMLMTLSRRVRELEKALNA